MGADVVEVIRISGVAQNIIPRRPLDSLLGDPGLIDDTNEPRILSFNTVVFHHVPVLQYDFICLRQLDGAEKVGQILVDDDVLGAHTESPALKLLGKYTLQDNDENRCESHDLNRGGPVDIDPLNMMLSRHAVSIPLDEMPFVVENLLVAEHPVAVEKQEKWRPFAEYRHYNRTF